MDRVNIIAGRVLEGDDPARHLSIYRDNLLRAVDLLAPEGIRIDIEAVNPTNVTGSLLPVPQSAVEIIEQVGREWIDLQFDVFHTVQVDMDPSATFLELIDYVGHMQFADAPERHEPGTGSVVWADVFQTIQNSRYEGWLSAEYRPSAATRESLGWISEYFSP